MKVETKIGEAVVSIETGKVARQAGGSVIVRMGETMVLATAVASNEKREGLDFVPFTVDYLERFYSVGRIPGNFFRREIGRPSEKEILTSRFIDRTCRPLFNKNWTFETQVIAQAISVDDKYDPDLLAMLGTSTALTLSDIPFTGPIAGARVVRVGGKLIVNPTQAKLETADLALIVAGNREAVVMVEGGALEATEADILDAIFLAHQTIQPLLDIQLELQKACGKGKRVPDEIARDEELIKKVVSEYRPAMMTALTIRGKQARQKKIFQLKTEVQAAIAEEHPDGKSDVSYALHHLEAEILRGMIVREGHRIDGRSLTEVRPITCEVSYLPRAHGSALFTRGETQSLGITTLGTSYDDQRLDTVIGDSFKTFMLHYNFPSFCTGEVKRLGAPGRREIGHGALAERALRAVIPPHETFPYTIRVVSEILESNGSSSMASVCSATLSLMDAGVPLKAPVAGVAMGLVVEGDQVIILTDILGDEDHLGDMDFKVAGTVAGITAVQMDIKISGVTREIMTRALEQAKESRLHILRKMKEVIAEPKKEISQYAPKMTIIEINPEKIKDVIGPGGKIIKSIQTETDTRLEVEDSGKVTIYAPTAEKAIAAVELVRRFTQEPELDKIYHGRVVKIMDFGAFVEILPGTDGLVHISQLASERVQRVTDVVKEGDLIDVKVLGIDKQGKIRLSRKAVLEGNNQ
ncbi:MAG: polyribonucleotide nucleotidyltransferase [Candidatus Adiutrix intracellularis]|jgi:polyribonucleotide nucleotidyltransferase|nr:MAG: polyribonucleotide nucleotidyltransferase [Candidatus Adiutrix intracellularis]MDR2826666.1 polyribonucleotide nucleotidyltransferase [Candidatus Adiutrix intracellularis]